MKIHDLHLHSSASCDSSTSMGDMCEAACGLGVGAIAFTDHVEFNSQDACYGAFDYHKARKIWEKVRYKYRGKLDVLFGAEVTYWSHLEDEIRLYLERHPFDLVIGSIHDAPPIDFWDARNAGVILANPSLARTALKGYFAETERLALSGLFDIVGHFGVYERHISSGWPNPLKDPYLKEAFVSAVKAVAKHARFEVNAAVLHKPGHWPAPRLEALELYKEMGGLPPTFGSDAHNPRQVARNWSLAQEMIEKVGFPRFAGWKEVPRKKTPEVFTLT